MSNRFSVDSARSARSGSESLTSLQRANVPGAFYLSSPVEMSEIVREGLHADASLIESTNNPKRNPSRIIRTFKEIEVPKVVTSEEWYEEMDCGICSHIIGVPHALVPCGHTFCGPCAWQWIKSNQNLTCPHCRVTILHETPFVPNILLDQIIERKLGALPDSTEKEEMYAERNEKAEAWKTLNAERTKSETKRTRGNLDDIIDNLFDYATPDFLVSEHRRRASRHVPELGAPVPRRPAHARGNTFNLGEARRADPEASLLQSQAALLQSHAELRRLRQSRENNMRELARLDRLVEDESMEFMSGEVGSPERTYTPPARLGGRYVSNNVVTRGVSEGLYQASQPRVRPLPAPPTLSRPVYVSTRSTPEVVRSPPPLPVRPAETYTRRAPPPLPPREDTTPSFAHHFAGRPAPVRSTALEARQARGRGTRDQPLVVLSDEE